MIMRAVGALLCIGGTLFNAAPSIAADSAAGYPSKAIRIYVGQSAGGATDIVARSLAQKLSESMGQPVVVDNRGGAAGSIAAALVAKAPPDGYTLGIAPSSYTINPSLYRSLPFDPTKDLVGVTLIASAPYIQLVHPSLPAKTTKELIALAKSRPKEIVYGSGGFGSSGHLAVELFVGMAGITLTHVPYKGAGPALVDLLGGQLQMVFASVVSGLPYTRTGKLRALAVTATKRLTVAPELPTIAESALPGYEFSSWFGMLVAAGTPPAIINKLQAETLKAIKAPDFAERLAREGSEGVASSPEQFAVVIKAEMAKWADVVKRSGMQPE